MRRNGVDRVSNVFRCNVKMQFAYSRKSFARQKRSFLLGRANLLRFSRDKRLEISYNIRTLIQKTLASRVKAWVIITTRSINAREKLTGSFHGLIDNRPSIRMTTNLLKNDPTNEPRLLEESHRAERRGCSTFYPDVNNYQCTSDFIVRIINSSREGERREVSDREEGLGIGKIEERIDVGWRTARHRGLYETFHLQQALESGNG